MKKFMIVSYFKRIIDVRGRQGPIWLYHDEEFRKALLLRGGLLERFQRNSANACAQGANPKLGSRVSRKAQRLDHRP